MSKKEEIKVSEDQDNYSKYVLIIVGIVVLFAVISLFIQGPIDTTIGKPTKIKEGGGTQGGGGGTQGGTLDSGIDYTIDGKGIIKFTDPLDGLQNCKGKVRDTYGRGTPSACYPEKWKRIISRFGAATEYCNSRCADAVREVLCALIDKDFENLCKTECNTVDSAGNPLDYYYIQQQNCNLCKIDDDTKNKCPLCLYFGRVKELSETTDDGQKLYSKCVDIPYEDTKDYRSLVTCIKEAEYSCGGGTGTGTTKDGKESTTSELPLGQ